MKIKNSNSSKKPIIIATAAVLLVIVALFVYLYAFKGSLFGWAPFASSNTAVNYNPPSKEQITAGNQAKTDTVNNTATDTDNPKTPTNDQSGAGTTSPSTNSSSVSVSITAANQNGATLQVRALISSTTTQGTCTLTLTKSGSTSVTENSNVQALADSSTCEGFDIPTSKLSSGTWTLALTYTNAGQSASATQTVQIR